MRQTLREVLINIGLDQKEACLILNARLQRTKKSGQFL